MSDLTPPQKLFVFNYPDEPISIKSQNDVTTHIDVKVRHDGTTAVSINDYNDEMEVVLSISSLIKLSERMQEAIVVAQENALHRKLLGD